MAVVPKKAVGIGFLAPKPFEEGYTFLVEAKIVDSEYDTTWPYLVEVTLDDGEGDRDSVSLEFNKEQLIKFVGKSNPKFKKDYVTQQIKDTKAALAALEKELEAIK